jgi:hypothetical protein
VIKIIWVLIGINITVLVIFVVYYLSSTAGRNVDVMEKGWMAILVGIGLLVILLAVLILRFSHSSFGQYVALAFAALPLIIGLGILISNYFPSFKNTQTLAEFYYKDKTQRGIATAIEQNDTTLLQELIKGQNLNIQGNRVWDGDGLNYLQFAVRLRDHAKDPSFNDQANMAAIRLLIEKGTTPTSALAEAVNKSMTETVALLLAAGADPNIHGYTNSDPLLFEAIGATKQQNDIAILLIEKGANINAKAPNYNEMTPVMFAANNAKTSEYWLDVWRLVRYLLEEKGCDYSYTTWDGNNLGKIIRSIRGEAQEKQIAMPADFIAVVDWLKQHHIDTVPVKQNN